jgi:hypothetical protein
VLFCSLYGYTNTAKRWYEQIAAANAKAGFVDKQLNLFGAAGSTLNPAGPNGAGVNSGIIQHARIQYPYEILAHGTNLVDELTVPPGVTLRFKAAPGAALVADGETGYNWFWIDENQTKRGGDKVHNMAFGHAETDWATPEAQLPPTLRILLQNAVAGETYNIAACRVEAPGVGITYKQDAVGTIHIRDEGLKTDSYQPTLFGADTAPLTALRPRPAPPPSRARPVALLGLWLCLSL